jgi:hypothetical protein
MQSPLCKCYLCCGNDRDKRRASKACHDSFNTLLSKCCVIFCALAINNVVTDLLKTFFTTNPTWLLNFYYALFIQLAVCMALPLYFQQFFHVGKDAGGVDTMLSFSLGMLEEMSGWAWVSGYVDLMF